jgi:hypothetical protein
MDAQIQRRVKGSAFIDLVKYLRKLRRYNPLVKLSSAGQALLDTHVLVSSWYPIEGFFDLLKVTDLVLIKGSEKKALELGAAAGMVQLSAVHKNIITTRDPGASVRATRHVWRAHYDFGEMTVASQDDKTVIFKLTGFPDITMVLGMMTVGWAVAAARIAGSQNESADVLERPWDGSSRLVYTIHV